MVQYQFIRRMLFVISLFLLFFACDKPDTKPAPPKVKADYTFTVTNAGQLPAIVSFSSTSSNATSFRWDFGNGSTSTSENPFTQYTSAGTFSVKLVAVGATGADSITKVVTIQQDKPQPNFAFVVLNQGFLPDTVSFTSTTVGATRLKWYFGDGKTDTVANPKNVYTNFGNFNVKLVATNAAGSDSITKQVQVILNKPVPQFTFTHSNTEYLPVNVLTQNTTIGSNVTYRWTVGTVTSTQTNLNASINSGGLHAIKLVATNASGSDSITKVLSISPFPQTYQSFENKAHNLFAWEGNRVTILSRSNTLNRITMYKWLTAIDKAYDYYKLCTGRDPTALPKTTLNGRSTIADVPSSSCGGAACGYLGATGIEMLNPYFDIAYNAINNTNQHDQVLFYELGRNFWFYGSQLAYKSNDPVTTGFAIFMRFMSMHAAGVNGAPFAQWTFPQFTGMVENLINLYLANPSLNWANTLGAGQGVPNSGLGASDLFASFCLRLMRDYGGNAFVQQVWKRAGLRPAASTTQDAVDNFFLASCAAANKNLTSVFQSWRWPLSASAITAAGQYP
jgi:PKD repeat protein